MKRAGVVPPITVVNAQRKRRIERDTLQTFASAALDLALAVPALSNDVLAHVDEVVVVLASDRRIAQLHKRFMNIAGPTDVITFQHGEIIVSVETAQRQAAQFGTSPDDEIRLYILHGILHLRGFDDTTFASTREMARMQERIFRKLSRTT